MYTNRFGLTAQSASAETFQWENAGKHGEMREIVGNGAVMEYRSDVGEYSWEGSPADPVFSRYTRYAATTRMNIDDF